MQPGSAASSRASVHLPAHRPAVECTTRHTHDNFQVAWAESGAGQVYCRGRNHAATTGTLVVIPPGEMHYGHSVGSSGWRYALVGLEPALLGAAAAELGDGAVSLPDFDWVARTDPELAGRFARWVRSPPGEALDKDTFLVQAVAALLARSAAGLRLTTIQRDQRAVSRALEYLEEHYARSLPLDELARESGLGKFHLVRAFKHQVGLPPHAYQTRLRVSRAMDLLRQGWSISHAAYSVGFAAQSHLHRHFKRILGVTPGEYSGRGRSAASP
jgi:AraC-like DNA-binding protein